MYKQRYIRQNTLTNDIKKSMKLCYKFQFLDIRIYYYYLRRFLYYQTILTIHDNEITKKIYLLMKNKPLINYWIELLEEDLSSINLSLEDEEDIKNVSKKNFNKFFKEAVRKKNVQRLGRKNIQ